MNKHEKRALTAAEFGRGSMRKMQADRGYSPYLDAAVGDDGHARLHSDDGDFDGDLQDSNWASHVDPIFYER